MDWLSFTDNGVITRFQWTVHSWVPGHLLRHLFPCVWVRTSRTEIPKWVPQMGISRLTKVRAGLGWSFVT
jgi:hypothetical protein